MSDSDIKKAEDQSNEHEERRKPAIARFFCAIGRWIKRHKGLFIFLVILAVGGIFVTRSVINIKKAAQMFMEQGQTMTTEVKMMDLSKTVSVTGTLEPKNTRTVKAAVSEAKVATIDVKVGDYVHEGDTLMTYDSEDLLDNLEDVQKQVDLENYRSDHNIKSTYNKQEDQQWTHDRQLEKLTADLQTLRNYYNLLLWGNDDYPSGKEYYEKHIKDYWELNAFNVNFQSYVDTSGQKHGLGLPIEREQRMDEDGDMVYEYDGEYDDVVTDFGAKLTQYEKDYIEFLNQNDDRLDDSEFNYNVAAMQGVIDHDNTDKKLKDAQDDIDEMIVKAPISGVITSISVEEGDKVYSNAQNKTVLCVIQDTSEFKVTGNVDEYDIASLIEGQKAVVKTDSTGDDEFPATLTFAAPTKDSTTSTSSGSSSASAALGSSSSSSSGDYEVELSLDSFDDRLRAGMTAKTSIILDEVAGVLAVPYDCVQKDDDGKKFVNVITDPGQMSPEAVAERMKKKKGKDDKDNGISMEKVYVEVIFESDYYMAIKGPGIKEGTLVEATASSGSNHDLFSMMMGGPGGGPDGGPGGM